MFDLPPARWRRVNSREEAASAFLQKANAVCSGQPAVLLLSDGQHEHGRFSFLCHRPRAIFVSKNGNHLLKTNCRGFRWRENSLSALQNVISAVHASTKKGHGLPDGLVGYLAYELYRQLIKTEGKAVDDLKLPDIWMIVPGAVTRHDHSAGTTTEFACEPFIPVQSIALVDNEPLPPDHPGKPADFRENTTAYLSAAAEIRRRISKGDVYQANLAHRITAELPCHPFTLFAELFRLNPAPFYAYINAGDHQIICSSMERFLRREDDTLESRPIKGTRPRGSTPEEDRQMVDQLLGSSKEEAELSMIVDLMRNDLSRVCRPGSVAVDKHMQLESYANVHHLVSTVRGLLRPGVTAAEILEATFPAGSISGCPKISALSIIDALEPAVRHAYTGSIGYFSTNGDFDLNVAIRTASVVRKEIHFGAGSGITWNSEPKSEWEETLAKADSLFETLARLHE